MNTLLPNELWNERLFTGTWVPGELPATAITSPGNGQALGTLANAGARQVEQSARVAATAQRGWYALPYDERAKVLRKAAAIAEQYQAEIADWIEAAEGRRRFLDRMVMSFAPDHAALALEYEKAMRQRNRLWTAFRTRQ